MPETGWLNSLFRCGVWVFVNGAYSTFFFLERNIQCAAARYLIVGDTAGRVTVRPHLSLIISVLNSVNGTSQTDASPASATYSQATQTPSHCSLPQAQLQSQSPSSHPPPSTKPSASRICATSSPTPLKFSGL